MIEVHVAGRWRRATAEGDAFRVLLADGPIFVGVVIGGAAMARRFREGTARVVSNDGPEPPAIRCSDPAVASILDACAIHRELRGVA